MSLGDICRFCWVDLATHDAPAALSFYRGLFGWQSAGCKAGGGAFHTLSAGEAEIGSLYQLNRDHIANGVPSHWTPYVSIADADGTVSVAEALGGQTLVAPFDVEGIARIALIQDPTGAVIGLFQRSPDVWDGVSTWGIQRKAKP